MESVLPVLLDKLSDSNARLRDSSRDAIVALAASKDAGIGNMTAAILKPVKSQTAWRPVLSTLQLLQELLPQLGVAGSGGKAGGGGDGGFELHDLMAYVGKAFNSPNADVRTAAVKVAVLAHDAAGPAVRRLLPKDMNPKIKEQLDATLGLDNAGEDNTQYQMFASRRQGQCWEPGGRDREAITCSGTATILLQCLAGTLAVPLWHAYLDRHVQHCLHSIRDMSPCP